MKTMTCKEILALHVIELTIGGHPAYYAPGQWDGAWFTRDLGKARKYKRLANATRIIGEFDRSSGPWATARVVPVTERS